MSDGQTHGERLEREFHYADLRPDGGVTFYTAHADGSTCSVRDSRQNVARLTRPQAVALRDFLNERLDVRAATPDRTAMLREAYALAKTQGDYNAMAEIASQL